MRYASRANKPALSISFEAPFYIMCEGSADAAFLDELLKNRGLPSQDFFVREMEGIAKLESNLQALQGSTSRKSLSHLAIVVDADLDPASRFLAVQTALNNASFQSPSAPCTSIKHNPSVGVWLMPGPSSQGNLETLLSGAVLAATPSYRTCVDAYEKCLQEPLSWDLGKRSKLQISALIAGVCKDDPSCSLTWVWGKATNPIPLSSAHFTPLADFLVQLSRL